MCHQAAGNDHIDGVEQLTRYLELLDREPVLTATGPVRGLDDPRHALF